VRDYPAGSHRIVERLVMKRMSDEMTFSKEIELKVPKSELQSKCCGADLKYWPGSPFVPYCKKCGREVREVIDNQPVSIH